MKRGRLVPIEQLLQAMRTAAANPTIKPARDVAARDADRIVKTNAETFGTTAGKFAEQGRALMRALGDADGAEAMNIAATLRDCAGALENEIRGSRVSRSLEGRTRAGRMPALR